MTWDHTPAEARGVLQGAAEQLQRLYGVLEKESGRFDPSQAPELWGAFNLVSQMVGGLAITASNQLARESIRQIGAVPADEPADDTAAYRIA